MHLHRRHPLPEAHQRPPLDRIEPLRDIEVPRVDYAKLTDSRLGEPSAAVKASVEAAREIQLPRFLANRGQTEGRALRAHLNTNAHMRPADVREHCKLDEAGTSLMRAAMSPLQLRPSPFTACSS